MKAAYGEDWEEKAGGLKEPEDGLTSPVLDEGKHCVFEIWDKRKKKVYHWVKGADKPLKELDDPYQLKGFFPCPRPLLANATTNNYRPITDYHIAQDQYNQLDVLYCRIQLIIEAIKVAGLYDASNSNIPRMLTTQENTLIPVDNWAMHAERGGARGQIDWFPVEQVATVLQHLLAQPITIAGGSQGMVGRSVTFDPQQITGWVRTINHRQVNVKAGKADLGVHFIP